MSSRHQIDCSLWVHRLVEPTSNLGTLPHRSRTSRIWFTFASKFSSFFFNFRLLFFEVSFIDFFGQLSCLTHVLQAFMAQSRSARLRVRPAPIAPTDASSNSPTLQFRTLPSPSSNSATSGASAKSAGTSSKRNSVASNSGRVSKRPSIGSSKNSTGNISVATSDLQGNTEQPLTPRQLSSPTSVTAASPKQAYQNYSVGNPHQSYSPQSYTPATGAIYPGSVAKQQQQQYMYPPPTTYGYNQLPAAASTGVYSATNTGAAGYYYGAATGNQFEQRWRKELLPLAKRPKRLVTKW